MVEIFKLPASLKKMRILDCSKLESIFSRRLQSASPNLQGQSPVYSEVSSSSAAVTRTERFLLPCLENIDIRRCDRLTGVLVLPPSLKGIIVSECGELRSVGSQSGEMPSLETLYIDDCGTLSSLPDGPQAYPSLQSLRISSCPGMKRLPRCLQQRLSSLKRKSLDGHLQEPSLFKPKTWRHAIHRD